MTVQELINALAAGVHDEKWMPTDEIEAVGPDCGGYDAVLDQGIRILPHVVTSEIRRVVIVGADDYESTGDARIEQWVSGF